MFSKRQAVNSLDDDGLKSQPGNSAKPAFSLFMGIG